MGLPLLTICSTCQGVIGGSALRLTDPAYRARINREHLADEGLEYQGTTDVKHFLWALVEDVGLDVVRGKVTRPLDGLGFSPFYGCYLRRPIDVIQRPERKLYLEQVTEALGGTNVDISGKGKCCGFPTLTINEENSLAMTAKHTAEAMDKGANAMVLPCPLCHLEMDGEQRNAAKAAGRDIEMPILHVPQVVGLALGFDPKELGLSRHLVSTKKFVRAAPARGRTRRGRRLITHSSCPARTASRSTTPAYAGSRSTASRSSRRRSAGMPPWPQPLPNSRRRWTPTASS